MGIIHMCIQCQRYWHKYRKQNMSAKQRIHKCSLMIKNKYGCQMHNTYAYYCWAKSLLTNLLSSSGAELITVASVYVYLCVHGFLSVSVSYWYMCVWVCVCNSSICVCQLISSIYLSLNDSVSYWVCLSIYLSVYLSYTKVNTYHNLNTLL